MVGQTCNAKAVMGFSVGEGRKIEPLDPTILTDRGEEPLGLAEIRVSGSRGMAGEVMYTEV